MNGRLAKPVLAYFLISCLGALAVAGCLLSGQSDPDNRFLLGLSVSRWAMVLAFLLVAAMSMLLAYLSWRKPAAIAGWIHGRLRPEGWSRAGLLFVSSAACLVALSAFLFQDWLPIPLAAYFRLRPAFFWLMLVATMSVASVIGLHVTDPPGPRDPAVSLGSDCKADRLFRELIIGCLVLVFCASALLLVCLLLQLIVTDRLDLATVALTRARWRGEFQPEQLERARYVAAAILFPVLAYLTWVVAERVQPGVPKSTGRLGTIIILLLTGLLGCWLYYSLRRVDFLYLRSLDPDLRLAFFVPLLAFFVLLIYIGKRYPRRAWMMPLRQIAAITVGVLIGLGVISASFLTSADDYAYTVHFNAYFYSIVQVFSGKTLLVDLSNEYGFYPYFLEPLLRPLGIGIPQLTLVMSAILIVGLSLVIYLLDRLVKSGLIATCGSIAIANAWLSTQRGDGPDPYFQYWHHRLVFPFILLLLVYFYQKGGATQRRWLYGLGFLVTGIAVLWNIETGLITLTTWVIYLCWDSLLGYRHSGARRFAASSARHVAAAVLTTLVTLGILSVFTYQRSGSYPDLSRLLFYQSIFYQTGFFMIPMHFVHPWTLVVLTYMVGLCVSVSFLRERLKAPLSLPDAATESRTHMTFVVSVLGVGLFTAYQGRSADNNLYFTFWSAFFLVTLFADSLLDRLVNPPARLCISWKLLVNRASLSLPLLLVAMLFAYTPNFLVNVPSSIRRIQSQIDDVRETTQGASNAYYTGRLDFMSRYFHPGEEVPIFSFHYNTVFYVQTQTVSPVPAPGWYEVILQSDVQQYAEFLESRGPAKFIVSDEFLGSFPELVSPIEDNYVEIDRVGDLGLFVRRYPGSGALITPPRVCSTLSPGNHGSWPACAAAATCTSPMQ